MVGTWSIFIQQAALPVHLPTLGNNEHRLPGSRAWFVTRLNAAIRAMAEQDGVDILAIDEALTRLTAFDPRQANILEMHFFAGLTFEEIALELGISARTVKRDWTMARAWLRHELTAWSKETAPGKPQLPPTQ